MMRRALPWVLGFVAVLTLSLDFWNWGKATPLIFGLPYWVVVFFLLNLMLGVYYFLFSVKYWRD
ncbi:MAG: hypothetical protein V1744_04530 [Candidatus Altiarchaeota archaeon]